MADEKRPPAVAGSGKVVVAVPARVKGIGWAYSTFAWAWLHDATREASDPGREARRREIVFAVCFLESYLFEWVRDYVLRRDWQVHEEALRALGRYFPPGRRIGIERRWVNVVQLLENDRDLQVRYDFGTGSWNRVVELVRMRDGLVHGAASRPATRPRAAGHGTGSPSQPQPEPQLLTEMPPGEPTRRVLRLLRETHAAFDEPLPVGLAEAVDHLGLG
jgi:hypothetical protein